MDDNFLINRNLQATRDGQTDPRHIVSVWVDELASALEFSERTSHEAYTLLATREKLRRVRSELLSEQDRHLIQQADQIIAAEGTVLADMALALLDPTSWQQELARFSDAFEDEINSVEQIVAASDLLDDLDDAQLLLVAAERLGKSEPELSSQLDDCETELLRHADLFYPATVYIQGIGQTLRTDLDEEDYALAATTLKFVDLLERFEELESELNFQNIMPLPPNVLKSLNHQIRLEKGLTQPQSRLVQQMRSYRNDLRTRPLAAAALLEASEAPRRYIWSSPDQAVVARMMLPAKAGHRNEEIRIGFFRASDQAPVSDWAGKSLLLGTLRATIDSEGIARFTLDQILQVNEPWRLSVEPDEREWSLSD